MFVFPVLFLGKFFISDTDNIYNPGFARFWGREGDVARKCKCLGQH